MKIVIFGYSKTGREIAKLLKKENYEFEIIDKDMENISRATEDGYSAKHFTFNDDAMLKDVGIGKDVNSLFCTSTDDSLNLFITLSARSICEDLKILTLIYRREDEKKMILAGANRTISPYDVGALKAFRIIEKPKVSKVLNLFAEQSNKLSMNEIIIPKGSILDGVSSKELQKYKEFDLIFLGMLDRVMSDEFIFFAEGIDHQIDAEDVLIALGSKINIKKFKKRIS